MINFWILFVISYHIPTKEESTWNSLYNSHVKESARSEGLYYISFLCSLRNFFNQSLISWDIKCRYFPAMTNGLRSGDSVFRKILSETWTSLLFFRDGHVDVDVDVAAARAFASWNRRGIKSGKKAVHFESWEKQEVVHDLLHRAAHCFPTDRRSSKHNESFVFVPNKKRIRYRGGIIQLCENLKLPKTPYKTNYDE